MEYKGYTIAISVSPSVSLATDYSASYKISHNGNGDACAGIIAGELKTFDDAYCAAEKAAYRWIDRRIISPSA